MNRIKELRDAIDDCDSELVSLIAKRQALVSELSRAKAENRIPVQVSEREAEIKNRLLDLANQQSVSSSLIIDIVQRIMRDSYRLQSQTSFSRATQNPMQITIIGGLGQVGRLFVELFERSGHEVKVLDIDDDLSLPMHYRSADLILLSVPFESFISNLQKLPQLNQTTILADLSSSKSEPVNKMLEFHAGPVIGLHPMFGPTLEHVAQQLIICSQGRHLDKCTWLIEQFRLWGCKVELLPAVQHDELMSYVQGARHLSAIVLGDLIMQNQVDLSQLSRVSTPAFRLELALMARLFTHHAELYVDILLSSTAHTEVLSQFSECHAKWAHLLKAQDRQSMMNRFTEIAEFLYEFSPNLASSSQQVLDSFLDSTKFSE
ncbi:MAG: bifunctional chorismate mutase/prephenate dehydrogenase [Gammaproteobacteria bacterium]|nr:bifunctional chorismate mutase/prephenate dehydrogenase [Gammaproteobacteria bacterium]